MTKHLISLILAAGAVMDARDCAEEDAKPILAQAEGRLAGILAAIEHESGINLDAIGADRFLRPGWRQLAA